MTYEYFGQFAETGEPYFKMSDGILYIHEHDTEPFAGFLEIIGSSYSDPEEEAKAIEVLRASVSDKYNIL